MNKEPKMKSAYEIAEYLLKKDLDVRGNAYSREFSYSYEEIEELTGISSKDLFKLYDKAKLIILIEKSNEVLGELETFFIGNKLIQRSQRYEVDFTPNTMELIKKLKKALEIEKSLLPTPTSESFKDD